MQQISNNVSKKDNIGVGSIKRKKKKWSFELQTFESSVLTGIRLTKFVVSHAMNRNIKDANLFRFVSRSGTKL